MSQSIGIYYEEFKWDQSVILINATIENIKFIELYNYFSFNEVDESAVNLSSKFNSLFNINVLITESLKNDLFNKFTEIDKHGDSGFNYIKLNEKYTIIISKNS